MLEDQDGVIEREKLALFLGMTLSDIEAVDEIAAQAPIRLRSIAHYAAFWGISDDGRRSELIRRTPDNLRRNLVLVVRLYEDQLEEWLAGPAAHGRDFSDAYIAYTCLVMASDESAALLS